MATTQATATVTSNANVGAIVKAYLNAGERIERRDTWTELSDSIREFEERDGWCNTDEDYAKRSALVFEVAMNAETTDETIDQESQVEFLPVYPRALVIDCFRMFCCHGPEVEDPFDDWTWTTIRPHDLGQFAQTLVENNIDADIVFDVLQKALDNYRLRGMWNPFARFKAAIAAWDNYAGAGQSWEEWATNVANDLNAAAERATSIDS